MDPASYAAQAEAFIGDLDREYYLHYSGQKDGFEIAEIYERYGELFAREAVERLRGALESAEGTDARRRALNLLGFAVDGHIGQATREEAAELATLESSLELELDGEKIPYRSAPIEQANSDDAQRRAAIEEARRVVLAEQLNPIYERAFERTHALVGELGWGSYREMCSELRGIDFAALEAQTRAFVAATEPVYAAAVDPVLEPIVGAKLGAARRSDLPRFFRAPGLDESYPAERLVDSFAETMTGLGIDVRAQRNVIFDTEPRPKKSPRAFCAPVKVPDEVYLVVPRVGGREDYNALFHEGGHTEHYANVDAVMPFEFRYLGDNSVTESFAFLFEHLVADRHWLEAVLGVGAEAAARIDAHQRASQLVFLRRYAAKIAYELELHGPGADRAAMPARYAELLGGFIGVEWPRESWLVDVDSSFYVACYLRAWALETFWRRSLRERFGERWFEVREAGEWLGELWREGQRLRGDELLAETLGEQLDFGVMAEEYAPAG